MEFETVAWVALAIGIAAAIGSMMASRRDRFRAFVVLASTALVLVSGASTVLAMGL